MRFPSLRILVVLALLVSGFPFIGKTEEIRSTSPNEKSAVKTVNLLNTMPGPEFGTLVIDSSPEGAEVTIDGFKTGYTTPLVLRGVRKGKDHSLVLKREGYLPWSGSLHLNDSVKSLNVSLKQK